MGLGLIFPHHKLNLSRFSLQKLKEVFLGELCPTTLYWEFLTPLLIITTSGVTLTMKKGAQPHQVTSVTTQPVYMVPILTTTPTIAYTIAMASLWDLFSFSKDNSVKPSLVGWTQTSETKEEKNCLERHIAMPAKHFSDKQKVKGVFKELMHSKNRLIYTHCKTSHCCCYTAIFCAHSPTSTLWPDSYL